MSEREKQVEERFEFLSNSCLLAPEAPEITEKLWGFAEAAYLDNPLPSVFKERLFAHLSRFCAVRYCIARHVGFLVGVRRPAGARMCVHKVSQTWLNSFGGHFHADKNFTLVYRCAQATPQPLLNDPEARNITSQSLLDELPALRFKADKAIGLLAAMWTHPTMPSLAKRWPGS